MVVRDIILVVAVLGVMVFGFFVMKRLDKFLDENRKRIEQEEKEKEPLRAFCKKARELGYEIYEMELVDAGENFYAEMKRSTNGGGENSPMLEGSDDFYELFFASLAR